MLAVQLQTARMAEGRQVITAEQIKAELDGSPQHDVKAEPLFGHARLTRPVLTDRTHLERIIEQAARRHGVAIELVREVIRAESDFRPFAVSPAGAKGLMQLMDRTARSLGVRNPFDPVQNVEAGTRYLKQLLDKYGSVKVALAAYNAGPARIDSLGIDSDAAYEEKASLLPAETQRYVARISARLQF
ncbi:MAG: lytic transglycosylase domain-containing protein [Brevibacillus sp.]|nr:lytic transglycosylase domain-containing protein [Brevibacillus sp.]